MKTVNLWHRTLQKFLLSLEKGLRIFKNTDPKKDLEKYFLMRDGLIRRFKLCIDSFWKFIKLYLEEVQKASVDTTKPKEILRLAIGDIITSEEHDILIEAISERNLTSHSYNEDLATEIQHHIPAYFTVMKQIIDRIKID